MNTRRKLATKEELGIKTIGPFTTDEIVKRNHDYAKESIERFKKDYRAVGFRASSLMVGDKTYSIQLNRCTNPFCQFYGLPQHRYEALKYKPSRYRLIGAKGGKLSKTNLYQAQLRCNQVEDIDLEGVSLENETNMVSNWSVAEEIARLITLNQTVPIEKEYVFHRDGCSHSDTTPFSHPKVFYRKGKVESGAQKYQCKQCLKKTSVLPKQDEAFNYGQKRNDVVLSIINDVLNRTPVSGTIRKLNIGASTYYHKIEWAYRKCLEFLERHETEVLQDKTFEELYLNTDALIYNLNYKRLKSNGTKRARAESKLPQTYVVGTSDLKSGYVFRADLAYDSTVTLEEIEADTKAYHCDHSYSYNRKNERLRHEYAPQPPTTKDNQTFSQYEAERKLFDDKRNYVDGLHVKYSYTAMAHFWLLHEQLKAKQMYFVTDMDPTIHSALFRVFCEEVKAKKLQVIACQINKGLTLEEANKETLKKRRELDKWAKDWGYGGMKVSEQIAMKLMDDLAYHQFYDMKEIDGAFYKYRGIYPIEHPYPFIDEGERYLTCVTDVSHLDDESLANILARCNLRSIDNFFQKIHRSLSVMERPLETARRKEKSYIYTNYNPKYAQQLITILRVYLNFCVPIGKGTKKLTPAQRLGLTDKVYTLKQIIYFK